MACPPLHAESRLGVPGRHSRHQDYVRRPPIGVCNTSSSHSPSASTHHAQLGTPPYHKGIHSSPSLLGCHQKDTYTRHSSNVLFQTIRSPEERRSKPTYHRPFSSQQAPKNSYLQDGAGSGHCILRHHSNVGLHSGSPRRFLPRSHSMGLPSLPRFRGRRTVLRFPNAPIRPFCGPLGICQNNKTHQIPHAPPFDPLPHLPGRFLPTRPVHSNSPRPHTVSSLPPGPLRPSCPHQKIPSNAFTSGSVSRSSLPSRIPPSFPSGRQDSSYRVPVSLGLISSIHVSPPPGTSGGSSQLCSSICTVRKTEASSRDSMDEHAHHSSYERLPSTPRPCSEGSPSSMDLPFSTEVSSSYVLPSSVCRTHDGRIPHGMGSDSFAPLSFRFLAAIFSLTLHQLARTTGSFSSPSGVSSPPPEPMRLADVRQHHGGRMLTQTGLSPLQSPHGSFYFHPGVLPLPWYPSGPETSERLPQRPCGPGISRGPDLYRVVSGHQDLPLARYPLPTSSSGPFCHQTQPPASLVHFPLPGSHGTGRKCSGGSLVPLGFNLPVPSFPATSQSLLPTAPVPGKRRSRSSLLCSIRILHQPSPQISGSHPSPPRPFLVSEDQRRPDLPPRPVGLQTSRVETIKQGLRSAGYTSAAAEIFLLQHRISTTRQYQSIWSKFMDYIYSQNVQHHLITVATVCNFLAHVATVDRLAYRTISGYRSALRIPIQWGCGIDIITPESDQFLRGLFHYQPPPVAAPMPDWDLNILLSFLNSPSFEPLSSASPRCLVQKTLCLLLLSTGRRIGEIANLSRSHTSVISGNLIYLSWVRDFKPKHHSASFQSPRPSIFYMDTSMPDDHLLCPARAFTTFLNVSDSWPVRKTSPHIRDHLWTLPSLRTPLSQDYLGNLFRTVVKSALSDSGLFSSKIYPHQMRKLSASHALAVGQNVDLVRKNMGFSSEYILRKNYVASVPPLSHACSLPGGPYFPPVSTR